MWQCAAFIHGSPAERSPPARQSLHLSAALQGVSAIHHACTGPHAGPLGLRQNQLCWWELYLQTAAVAMGTMRGGRNTALYLQVKPSHPEHSTAPTLTSSRLSVFHKILSLLKRLWKGIFDNACKSNILSQLYTVLFLLLNRNFCVHKHLLKENNRHIEEYLTTQRSKGQVW